jgi:hypothetical protein
MGWMDDIDSIVPISELDPWHCQEYIILFSNSGRLCVDTCCCFFDRFHSSMLLLFRLDYFHNNMATMYYNATNITYFRVPMTSNRTLLITVSDSLDLHTIKRLLPLNHTMDNHSTTPGTIFTDPHKFNIITLMLEISLLILLLIMIGLLIYIKFKRNPVHATYAQAKPTGGMVDHRFHFDDIDRQKERVSATNQ